MTEPKAKTIDEGPFVLPILAGGQPLRVSQLCKSGMKVTSDEYIDEAALRPP